MYMHMCIAYMSFEGQELFLHSASFVSSASYHSLVVLPHLIPTLIGREGTSPLATITKLKETM